MTEKYNASLAAGASSADLTVAALEPHGINPQVECQVFSKNLTTSKLFELAKLSPNQAAVIYPTTDTLVITNTSAAAGVVQLTAK